MYNFFQIVHTAFSCKSRSAEISDYLKIFKGENQVEITKFSCFFFVVVVCFILFSFVLSLVSLWFLFVCLFFFLLFFSAEEFKTSFS